MPRTCKPIVVLFFGAAAFLAGATFLAGSGQSDKGAGKGTDKGTEKAAGTQMGPEAREVERTVRAKAGIYSDDNPKVEDEDARRKASEGFYSYSDPKLRYFTPVTPIVPSAKEYIDELNTTMEWYQSQGVKFRVQVEDVQVRQVGKMAVAVCKMSTTLTFPDKTVERNPARWTVVLENKGDAWLSIHEHLSFYSEKEQEDAPARVRQYREDIPKFRKRDLKKDGK